MTPPDAANESAADSGRPDTAAASGDGWADVRLDAATVDAANGYLPTDANAEGDADGAPDLGETGACDVAIPPEAQPFEGGGERVALDWVVTGPTDAAVRVLSAEGAVLGLCEAGASPCSVTVPLGTKVKLAASVSPGTAIVSWFGCDGVDDADSCGVALDRPRQVSAQVARGYVLRIGTAGTGAGGVTVYASSAVVADHCTARCNVVVPAGSLAVLTAEPEPGSQFASWTEGGSSNPRSVEMSEDRAFTAQFVWTPAAMPTLRLWLDAGHGVETTSEMKVTRWNDRSATATHFEPPDATRQPAYSPMGIMGHAAVQFDGSQCLLNSTTALDAEGGEFVLSVVTSNQTPAERAGVVWHQRELAIVQSWDEAFLGFNTGGAASVCAQINGCWQVSGPASIQISGDRWNAAAPHLFTMRRLNASRDTQPYSSLSFRMDGVETDSQPSNQFCAGIGNVALGARIKPFCMATCSARFDDFFEGQVAEVVYAVGATSFDDVKRLEQYLLDKYGLPPP
jgi:hypothetical protein